MAIDQQRIVGELPRRPVRMASPEERSFASLSKWPVKLQGLYKSGRMDAQAQRMLKMWAEKNTPTPGVGEVPLETIAVELLERQVTSRDTGVTVATVCWLSSNPGIDFMTEFLESIGWTVTRPGGTPAQ